MKRICYRSMTCSNRDTYLCHRCQQYDEYVPKKRPLDVNMPKTTDAYNSLINMIYGVPLHITKVIFNDPATIVMWPDGTKTVVKATNEPFDPEKGLAMAISKKLLGNRGNYYNTFKKWLPDTEEED